MSLPNVSVDDSAIHGKGLFAGQIIDEGTRIIEYVGDVIDWDEVQVRRQQYEAEGIVEKYFMELGDGESYIDGTINGNYSRYVNHSCEPNCYLEYDEESNGPHIWIISLREILEGDEITVDYELDDGTPCNCQSPNCRRFL